MSVREYKKIHRRDTENTERAQSRLFSLRYRRVRSTSSAICVLCLSAVNLFAFSAGLAQTIDQDHKAAVEGVEIGMNAQQVFDQLKRMPDARKDEKDEIILTWKLKDASVLQLKFRKEHVSHIALQYHQPRPTEELWLQQTLHSGPSHDLTGRDPRLRIDYRATETKDKLRTVWTRQEKAAGGYTVEVQFLSTSRMVRGDRFEDYVEFKYVTVVKDDIKRFEKAVEQK